MADSIDKSDQSTGSPDRPARPERRRLLRGAAASVPVVMTLHSGTAQAMASITCGDKALRSQANASYHPATLVQDPDEDELLRHRVDIYDKKVQVLRDGQWVWENDGQPSYFPGKHEGQPCWRHYNCTIASASSEAPEDCGEKIGERWALAHVDAQTGDLVAVGAPQNPHDAIYTSAAGNCLVSLQNRSL